MKPNHPIAIIGGGLAGRASACVLPARRHDVNTLDRDRGGNPAVPAPRAA